LGEIMSDKKKYMKGKKMTADQQNTIRVPHDRFGKYQCSVIGLAKALIDGKKIIYATYGENTAQAERMKNLLTKLGIKTVYKPFFKNTTFLGYDFTVKND